MKVKKFNLGFIRVEHRIEETKEKPKFIKIERVKSSESVYRPTLESPISIEVMPKNLYEMIKREKPKELPKKQKLTGKQKIFYNLIDEIRFLFSNLFVFEALLTAIILFLLSYIFITLFGMGIIYAFVLPVLYSALYLFLKLKENEYVRVEKKFPKLNEKLRTAVDNISRENPVVDELKSEVYKDIKEVDYASFFHDKKTSYKVLLIILLCISIIFLAKYDVEFKFDFKDRILGFMQGNGGNATNILSDIISATITGPEEDIYGEEELAKLGQDKLTININKVGYEINMNDIKQPESQEFEESPFPSDIGLEKAEVYSKRFPKEDQELVKNYFKSMAQG